MKAKLTFLMILLTAFIMADAQNRRPQITYTTERDIPYREADANEYARERCKVDFYYPENVKDFPTVVWFHGGAIVSGSKEIPAELQNSGMGIIGVNYRLLPNATIYEVIDDAAAAVAWAFREVEKRGGSTSKIFLAGHSAGGYLIDMIVLDKHYLEKYGIDADRIAGVFPYSAQVITHYNVRKDSGVGPLEPRIDDTAPLYFVRKIPMPMLVLSGDRELELYGRYEEQAYFWRMLKLVGHKDVTLYEMQGYDHGAMPFPAYKILKDHIRRITTSQ